MVKPKRITTLNVLMNGRLVGYLCKLSSGAMNFQYDEAWLETSGVRPILLSLPPERGTPSLSGVGDASPKV